MKTGRRNAAKIQRPSAGGARLQTCHLVPTEDILIKPQNDSSLCNQTKCLGLPHWEGDVNCEQEHRLLKQCSFPKQILALCTHASPSLCLLPSLIRLNLTASDIWITPSTRDQKRVCVLIYMKTSRKESGFTRKGSGMSSALSQAPESNHQNTCRTPQPHQVIVHQLARGLLESKEEVGQCIPTVKEENKTSLLLHHVI